MHHRVQREKKKQGEALKTFLRECRAYNEKSTLIPLKYKAKRESQCDTAEIEGEEVQKTFLRECRTYSEKSTLIHRKINGEAEK
jgi:hypothetical protein